MQLKYWTSVCIVQLVLFANFPAWAEKQSADSEFFCDGKLEAEVWQLWDGSAKEYLRSQQFTKRLKEQGDTYALYDVQTYAHNLVAMTQRCNRVDRLQELAELLGKAFSTLEAAPDSKAGRAWVCKGGAVCNEKNRLINKEVLLTSLQFLALTTSVANGLSQVSNQKQDKFVELTAIASLQHLLRWGDADAVRQLKKQIGAQAQDVKDGSSALFFSDKHLWMIAVYADLAGIFQDNPRVLAEAKLTEEQLQGMRQHLFWMLKLFATRITLLDGVGRNGRPVKLADLDRGFWRRYADNRYAGYTGGEKPVNCIKQADGTFKTQVSLNAGIFEPVENIGWDISHARRLVHAFDAIERNREAMQQFWRVAQDDLPSVGIMRAFAHQLLEKVWNGDAEYPLFSNYWSGANGWYRVGYDNGTPRCMEGYPPFGLSNAFATGGYASWARYDPEIRTLGRRLYRLSVSDIEADRLFMDKYYPGLGTKAGVGNRMLTQLMFWPSLVETRQ